MNKAELIKAVSEDSGMTKVDCERALDSILSTITTTVASGDDVKLVGFGSFECKDRAARQGRNPKTGEGVHIPAKKAVGFKVGKALKDAVNA